jgi:hypothetical protein
MLPPSLSDAASHFSGPTFFYATASGGPEHGGERERFGRGTRATGGELKLLLARGARPTDKDLQGTTVREAGTSVWISELLMKAG